MFRSAIDKILSSFVPIGLSEMDDVSLMDRVETKYVFSSGKLTGLINQLSDSYKILEIDSLRVFPYHTTYLDTPERILFTQQIRGKLNRYKVRYRCYECSGASFLEIKMKTNRLKTIKWRIESSLETKTTDTDVSDFLNQYLPYDFLDLKPVLINRFNRITLVGKEIKERITLDFNLNFSDVNGIVTELPCICVAELKRERFNCKSPFIHIMKKAAIQPNGFSKYCIGTALTCNIIRRNTLKPNLMLINKIENEYTESA
jgi:hypothetical protein